MVKIRNKMWKKCFVSGCPAPISFKCDCQSSITYSCEVHITGHISIKNLNQNHNPIRTSTNLSNSQTSSSLKSLKICLAHLNSLKEQTIFQTSDLYQKISEVSNATLEMISTMEENLISFLKSLSSSQQVCEEIFELISNCKMSDKNFSSDFQEKTLDEIRNLFSIDPFISTKPIGTPGIESDFVVFSKDFTNGRLCTISLDSKQLKNYNHFTIASFATACKVRNSVFFFNGGIRNSQDIEESYLVNFEKNTIEVLPSSGIKRSSSACVCKDGVIYVFGGMIGQDPTKKCNKFDFAQNEWGRVSDLPCESGSNTAAIANNQILVSGFYCPKVYSFKGSSYSDALVINDNSHKVLCGNWIITQNTLYVNENEKNNKWKSVRIEWLENVLWVSAVFKKEIYIYFITIDQVLWRLNTLTNSIERISYA